MKQRRSVASLCLIALLISGCTSGIPLFDAKARLINRIDSGLELLAEVNNQVAQARNDGLVTQATIKDAIAPRLDHAEAILKQARAIARASATSQPTTQPIGTLDEARSILKSVQAILLQLQRSKS